MNKRLKKKKLTEKRMIILEKTLNTRHLGGFKTKDGRKTKDFKFIRSDAPSNLPDADIEKLKKIGVGTVIDLRRDDERKKHPNDFENCNDVDFFPISVMLDKDDLPPHLLDDENITMGDFYVKMLSDESYPYKPVFEAVLNSKKGVLFHCAIGKDRTGVLAALLLMLAGAAKEEIVADYTMSGKNLAPEFAKLPEAAAEHGRKLSEMTKMLKSEPEYILKVIDFIENEYKTVENYLAVMGFSGNEINSIKEKMF